MEEMPQRMGLKQVPYLSHILKKIKKNSLYQI